MKDKLPDEDIKALTQERLYSRAVQFFLSYVPEEGLVEVDVTADVVRALALEVQEYRAFRSVMAEAVRDVNAGEITPFDALARIVAELASLDSRAVADGH